MKEPKRTAFDRLPEIKTIKSLGVPTNPLFEEKRLEAIEFIKKYPIPKRVRNEASRH